MKPASLAASASPPSRTPEEDRPLGAVALRRIRRIVRQAHRRDARAAPVTELIALAAEVPAGANLTIDFDAASELGQPLVVLRLAGAATPAAPGSARSHPRFAVLTAREREVAALVAAGLTNREIAARLSIALGTVKDHVHHILAKTGFRNRAAVGAAWGADPPRSD